MSRTKILTVILIVIIGVSNATLALLFSHEQTLRNVRQFVIFNADVCEDNVNAGYGFHIISKDYDSPSLRLDYIFGYIAEIDYSVTPIEPHDCPQFILKRYIYAKSPLENRYYEILSPNPSLSDVLPNLRLDNKTISTIKTMCPNLKRAVLDINVEFKDSYIVLDSWARPARIARLQTVFPEKVVTLRVPLIIEGGNAKLIPRKTNYTTGLFDIDRTQSHWIPSSNCKSFFFSLVEKESFALRKANVRPPNALNAPGYLVWVLIVESILLSIAGLIVARGSKQGDNK